MPFWVKNCWTLSVVWAGMLINQWNGQVYSKSLQKVFTEVENAASHNNASQYTDTDGFLEHLPNRGSLYYKGSTLQKIIPGIFLSSLICLCLYLLLCTANILEMINDLECYSPNNWHQREATIMTSWEDPSMGEWQKSRTWKKSL